MLNWFTLTWVLQVGGPVLTEDTALEFKALNGLPGPYVYGTGEAEFPFPMPQLLTRPPQEVLPLRSRSRRAQ